MEEKINALIDSLLFVENDSLKRVMLKSFIEKNGEIPEEYQDAVNVVLEM